MKKVNTILQLSNLSTNSNTRLRELAKVVSLKDLDSQKENITALVTTGGVAVNADLINTLPKLKVIVNRGIGFDHIDIKEAFRKNILVSNTPEVLTDCVADLAFSGLLAISRKIIEANTFVKEGKWLNNKFEMTTKVSYKKLGIVGFGRIGQAIAKRAAAFNMQVQYYSRNEKSDFSQTFQPSLIKLAKFSDFLVICAPGGETTRGLISHEVLEALGKSSFLINVARGSLVDEKALIQVIKNEKIAGAVLDVFEKEPLVPQELINSKKVILLPHIGSRTKETFLAMEELLLQNLEEYFTTGKLLTPVKEG